MQLSSVQFSSVEFSSVQLTWVEIYVYLSVHLCWQAGCTFQTPYPKNKSKKKGPPNKMAELCLQDLALRSIFKSKSDANILTATAGRRRAAAGRLCCFLFHEDYEWLALCAIDRYGLSYLHQLDTCLMRPVANANLKPSVWLEPFSPLSSAWIRVTYLSSSAAPLDRQRSLWWLWHRWQLVAGSLQR